MAADPSGLPHHPEAWSTAAAVLALTRESGSPGLAEARELVARHLRARGYAVAIEPFRCTASTLLVLPILGAGVGWLALLVVPLLVLPGPPRWSALALWLAGAASLALLAGGIGAGRAPAPLGGPPRDDANLIATRSPEVRRWIVAHLDTKAQGHSLAGRLVAVWLLVATALLLTAATAARLAAPLPAAAAAGVTATALVAGALAARGRLRGGSRGARDNGSGVLAALAAADALGDGATGILITGGEELGLAGARAFAGEHPAKVRGATVVNFDTLDDRGPLWVVSHDAAGDALAARAAARLGGIGLDVRRRRLPLGILTDSLALARAGAAAITIARLDWDTLRRLHTPSDTPDGLAFATALAVGRAIGGEVI
ncbi:MAG TPA: M28 family peptidase [Gemmatimonadales bacterium]|nr:M28 family peptidase [Gemmatimonadales bacterium]